MEQRNPPNHAKAREPSQLVSIVVPNFNKAARLELTVLSALGQGDKVEVIVVDDASTDGSLEVLDRLESAHRGLRTIRLSSNKGGNHCRNLGLEQASGEFVIFLDSDDRLLPGCCARRLVEVTHNSACDAWVFPMTVVSESGGPGSETWRPSSEGALRKFLAHRIAWQTMQPIWRTRFVRELGGFDPMFPRLQDPEFHARALLSGARVRCYPQAEPDCEYYVERSRHGSGAGSVRRRHIDASILFYRKFAPVVPNDLRGEVAGTLLEAMAATDNWRRTGAISTKDARQMQLELIGACNNAPQRMVLQAYLVTCAVLPEHVRGVRAAFRTALRTAGAITSRLPLWRSRPEAR